MANDVASKGAAHAGASSGADADGSAARVDMDELHETRRKRLIGIACVAAISIMGPGIAVHAVLAGGAVTAVASGAVLGLALFIAARIRNRAPHAASATVLAVLALCYPVLALQSGGFDAPVLLAIPMIPILVVPFAGARRALALSAALVGGGVAVCLAERFGVVAPTPLTETGTRLMHGLVGLVCVVGGTVMAIATERERSRLEAALVAQTRTLYEASVRDPLTHLYNRRHLAERLAQELAFAVRHVTPLSIVLLDIDHFKRINDDLGHAGGDEVLVAVSGRLSASGRREDIVARHGGEEFAILLRGLDIEGARTVAERMRVAVDRSAFKVGEHARRVAISAGCASLACCGDPTVDALLAAADSRLYAAKHAGRNRVVSLG